MTGQESTHWAAVELPKTSSVNLLEKVNTFTLEFASFLMFCINVPLALFHLPEAAGYPPLGMGL